MICKKCGVDNPDTNDFCAKCGGRLKAGEKTASGGRNALIAVLAVVSVLALAGLVAVLLMQTGGGQGLLGKEADASGTTPASTRATTQAPPVATDASQSPEPNPSGASPAPGKTGAPSGGATPSPSAFMTLVPIVPSFDVVTPTPQLSFSLATPPLFSTPTPKVSFVIAPTLSLSTPLVNDAAGSWYCEDWGYTLELNADYTFLWYDIENNATTGTYAYDPSTGKGSFNEYYFDFTVTSGTVLVAQDPNGIYVFRRS